MNDKKKPSAPVEEERWAMKESQWRGKKFLDEAEAQGCTSAEEYRKTNPIGGSRAKGARVSRPPEEAASAPNWLKDAAHRRPLKKKGEQSA